MNILEVLKSGKQYRRKSWSSDWLSSEDNPIFSKDMVEADDWEVKDEHRELSWGQIKAAIQKGVTVYIREPYLKWDADDPRISWSIDDVKNSLGFKE